MADVAFEHVTKRYGGQSAVINDLNLRVRDHEFLILVGPSGCGKSTALRMIAGLEEISEGELTIGGQRMNDIPPKDRDIAMVFQNYALYPHMSVRDNLAFSLKLRGTPTSEITERVKRAAETLGLGEYLARRPRELSGGQRQRVALGRALVRQPQVFLLDEPLSNLDAKLRVQTRAEIARLHQTTGTTFVYVTHDQVEAMTMGDRIAVMNAGVIQQLGAPQELYDRPANLFVAGFIGSPAMSFLSARLVGVGDAATVTFEGSEGRAVIAGVRPEHLRLANDGAGAISGVVELVEHLGNEQLLYISTPAALALEPAGQPRADGALERPRIVARLSAAERATPGANVSLAIDPARLHLFDLATGSRLAGDLEGVMA